MKYYKCNFMLSFIGLMLSLSSALAYAYPLSNQPHTPPLSLEPGSLSSDSSYDIAKVFWLPDYQTSMNGRTENPDKPGGGDLPIGKKTCSTYGFQATYDNTKYVCDTVKPIIGMTCYTNCKCKPTVIPGVGEECDITCGSACVKSKCKPAVTFTNPNDRCTQKCTQNQNVCTAKTCDSKCASGTSLTCTGPVSGNDGCGQSCKKCCEEACPSGTTEANPGGCGGSVQNGCGTKTCYYAYKACCTVACPSGTTESNPGGCGGSTKNGCNTKTCYYAYRACCDDSGYSSCGRNEYARGFTNDCGNYRYFCYGGYCTDHIYQAESCHYTGSYYTGTGARARAECVRPDGTTYTKNDVGYVYANVNGTVISYDFAECQKIMNERGVKVGEVKSSYYSW